MRIILLFALGSLAGFASLTSTAATLTQPSVPMSSLLAQNTGAADRTLGNSSMGLGDGIERLPERLEADRDEQERPPKAYDESGHGDNDTDMEHRRRRTLGDSAED